MPRLLAFILLLVTATPAAAALDELHEAARLGDLATVERLLAAGADPNGWPDSSSPLMFAAEAGHAAVVALLLAHGAEVERRDHNGERALLRAAQQGQAETLRLLLEAGAAPDSSDDPYGGSPLIEASRHGHVAAARLLLEAGADPRWQSDSGWTPLYAATQSGSAELVALLLAAGAETNPADARAHATPLHDAALYGRPAIAALLVEAGAALEARDYDGRTPLYLAAMQNHAALALLLLAAGADPDAPDAQGQTPILAAIGFPASDSFDHGSVAALLASRTADLDRAFAAALWSDLPAVAGILLARGASVDAVDVHGRPALAAVARAADDRALRRLLEAGADVARHGAAALMEAAAHGRETNALRLLQAGVPVDARDALGATALLHAAGQGQVEMVRWLLAAGADPAAVDGEGRGAADYMTRTIDVILQEIDFRGRSRALRPVEHLEREILDFEAKYAEIRVLLGLPE